MRTKSTNCASSTTVCSPAVQSDWGLDWAYWSLPLLLTGIQYWVTATSMHEIRYEELAESVRNVFWLSHRLLYDGASTNIGWYGTLLVVYKLFGFSLYSAKFVRLALHCLGLTCAADILRRCVGTRTAIVPLVAIGLSPTLLYFNSLQTSNGIDLPYAAICLWVLFSIRPESRAPLELVKFSLCGMVAMMAAMSYPTFLLYWPSLLLVSVWWLKRDKNAGPSGLWRIWQGLSATAGLALPLVIVSAYLIKPGLLFWDPATHAGLFRGGGVLGFNPVIFARAVTGVLRDLLIQGRSYYFEVTRPDFRGPLAIAGLCCVGATTIYLWLTRQANMVILLAAVLLLAVSLVVPSLSIDNTPGIRRSTGILAAYFVLFSMTWYFYRTAAAPSMIWARRTGVLLCLLVPLDSAFKLPSLVQDLTRVSNFRNANWFAIAATPTKSLEVLLEQLDEGKPLTCPMDDERRIIPCRYQEVYAAMAGYRLWNNRSTPDIRAVDWKTGRDITLTPSLWTSYYFPH
jgi:drug/metabolite transporter superfamily protein YnfA